ncbi:zinc finger protein 615 [Bicyclus anynana]|uniref:Zinc finger protein 615 n=1 Tax=Bicyclus anynana TaxID=110368 RepID=A0A6J1NW29_BICAN|nr:zinc finger protein 615 [Bicyclus anynana]XP_052745758.1 zinc finger protein 615 [Bicyclus anynana]
MCASSSLTQFCTICLETESKLYVIGEHKLGQAYGHLTGYALCEEECSNTCLCPECIHRLLVYERFRLKSLRARTVIQDLLRDYKVVTLQHIKSIGRHTFKLKSDIVKKVLEPNHCDLYIDKSNEETKLDTDSLKEDTLIHEDVESAIIDVASITESNHKQDRLTVKPEIIDLCDEDGYLSDSTLILETAPNFESEMNFQEQLWNETEKHSVGFTKTMGIKSEKNLELLSEEANIDDSLTNNEKPINKQRNLQQKLKFETMENFTECNDYMNSEIMYGFNNNHNIEIKNEKPHNFESKMQSKLQFETQENFTDFGETDEKKLFVKREIESDYKPHSCELCDFKCKLKISLTVHARTHGENSFTCQICNYKCKLRHTLNIHMKKHKDAVKTETHYICDTCETKFDFKSKLVTHMRTHTEKRYFKCKICDYKCKLRHTLNLHMKLHKLPFVCNICDAKFTLKGNLSRHLKTHLSALFACHICNYKTSRKDSLENHVKGHVKECHLCKLQFKQSHHLYNHMLTHSGYKPYECKLCEQKFTQKVSLYRHMAIHRRVRPFACNLCPYRCLSNHDLVKHMRTHTGEKPYACKYCDFRSSRKYNLLTHMRSHTGEKPYVCNVCHYCCTKISDLRRHMRSHTGETFACAVCDYKCTRRSNLQAHMRAHSGQMYICDHCGYKTVHRSCVKIHIMRHMTLMEGNKELV